MLQHWDGRAVVWLATHRLAFANTPSVWLGTVEKLGAIWVVIGFCAALLKARRLKPAVLVAASTAVITLAADSLSFAIKDFTARRRPFQVYPEIHPLYRVHSSSFPAGHAATAFAAATLLSVVFPRLTPLLLLLATLIGLSRIYDGVHYPTDVAAGAAIGAFTAGAGIVAFRRFSRSRASFRRLQLD